MAGECDHRTGLPETSMQVVKLGVVDKGAAAIDAASRRLAHGNKESRINLPSRRREHAVFEGYFVAAEFFHQRRAIHPGGCHWHRLMIQRPPIARLGRGAARDGKRKVARTIGKRSPSLIRILLGRAGHEREITAFANDAIFFPHDLLGHAETVESLDSLRPGSTDELNGRRTESARCHLLDHQSGGTDAILPNHGHAKKVDGRLYAIAAEIRLTHSG